MIDEKVIALAQAHYANSREPLLLAEFGKALRQASLWPQKDQKKLFDYVSSLGPEISVVRDEKAPAYSVVVVSGKEKIASEAIRNRHDRNYIENFPRSFIIAFVANNDADQKIYVRRSAPYRYQRSSSRPSDEYLEVQEEFRHPGLDLRDIGLLRTDTVTKLATSVRAWFAHNELSEYEFSKPGPVTGKRSTNNSEHIAKSGFAPSSFKAPINALNRLYAAQPSDVADRFVVPLDIAVFLSRIN